jgi:hypothetical protein
MSSLLFLREIKRPPTLMEQAIGILIAYYSPVIVGLPYIAPLVGEEKRRNDVSESRN